MMNDQSFWKSIVKEDAVLNPVDRISEVLFGTIMVLSFTGAISAATDGRQEIRELLWAALGCNVAWGLVDAIMYLMNVVLERAHSCHTYTTNYAFRKQRVIAADLKGGNSTPCFGASKR